MMTNRKKLLITRRRTEFFVLRRRFGFEHFCSTCGAESRFVSLEDAMLLSNLTMREIVRRADRGEFHFLESGGGFLVVCRKSLPENVAAPLKNFVKTDESPALKRGFK